MSTLSRALSGDWTDELVVAGPADARYDETSDGAHIVLFEEAEDGRVRVGWDGRVSEPFTLVPQQSGNPLAWSPAGLHAAWYGTRDGQPFVAVDGIEHPADDITRSVPPTFSDAGGHVAYGVYLDGVARLIYDGEPLGDWMPAPIRPVFSPDGTRFAFVAENQQLKRGDKRSGYRQRVVLDGVPEPEAEGISSSEDHGLQFSPDGRRLAYARIDGNQVGLVVDGVTRDSAPNLAFPTFSPDSRRVAYGLGVKDGFVLAGDGVSSGSSYWRIAPPVFSPDSARMAVLAFRSKGRGVAVIDGAEGPEFADTWGNAVFSPDSRHVAYLSMRKAGGFLSRSMNLNLVLDGVAGSTWDEVSSPPHFSPDSAHVAFSARRGKDWVTVLDDEASPGFQHVGPPRFSATGRLGYLVAERGVGGSPKYRVVADGIEPPAVADVAYVTPDETFVFSPDGEHVATAGRIDPWWRPIVDGDAGPGGLGVGSLRFDGEVVSFLVGGQDGPHRVSTRLRPRSS